MGVTWSGADDFKRFLDRFPAQMDLAISGALFEEAESIMGKSRPLVPVDTGVLRNSGHVALPEHEGRKITVTFGYGGAASAYALVQHERMDYRHTVGQAKYLEQPTLEAQHGLEPRLGARVKRRVRV